MPRAETKEAGGTPAVRSPAGEEGWGGCVLLGRAPWGYAADSMAGADQLRRRRARRGMAERERRVREAGSGMGEDEVKSSKVKG